MIIGLAGKKQTGKDTSSIYLSKIPHLNLKHVAFATKLKQITGDLFGLDFFNMIGEEKELHRIKLQFVGDTMRELEPYIWIDSLFREHPDNIVISDVRYPNEVNRIKELGGYVIHIKRNTGMFDSHNSENALKNFSCFDAEIDNNGTFEDLYRQLNEIMLMIYGVK